MNVYNEVFEPVEVGGSIFVSVNHILQHAVSTFGLSTDGRIAGDHTLQGDPDVLLGIWDGSSFVLKHQTSSESNPLEKWWRQARILWKYGLAPVWAQRLVKDVVTKFLHMYQAPYFPFLSVTRVVDQVNLTSVTAQSGWSFLEENKLTGPFAWELMQAATRVNYASDLKDIHGVESMVSMATDGAVQVDGGNWQIFAAFANASGADVRLKTTVEGVRKDPRSQKYVVETASENDEVENDDDGTYDAIIIAAPYHQTNIKFEDGILSHMPRDDPYRALHVTLFTTALPLSREYFGLSIVDEVPTTILTTEPPCENPDESTTCPHDQRYPQFNSISTLRAIVNPMTGRREFLYKIFTMEEASDAFLAKLFDLELQTDDHVSSDDITWIYRKRWLSYPVEYPRETFEPVRLDDGVGGGIWYTASMEGFISTMETNALSGKNVARLVADEWAAGGVDEGLDRQEKQKPLVSDEL